MLSGPDSTTTEHNHWLVAWLLTDHAAIVEMSVEPRLGKAHPPPKHTSARTHDTYDIQVVESVIEKRDLGNDNDTK
jgi:hypothetical protein